MAITVATWNAHEALAEPDDMPAAVEHIKGFDADVAVITDAHSVENHLHGSTAETLHEAHSRLDAQGYQWWEVAYEDGFRHDRNIMMLSRLAVAHAVPVRLSTRNAHSMAVYDQNGGDALHIVGLHLDDQTEQSRLQQAVALLECVHPEQPTVLAGDLNSIHTTDMWPRIFRSRLTREAAAALPKERWRYNLERITAMAGGSVIRHLQDNGFRDADCLHRPTFPAQVPLLQLDHLMLSESVRLESYTVSSRSHVSDHRSVVASVSMR